MPYVSPHAWVCAGAQQLPLTVSTPAKYIYDERSKLIQAVPANALGWGAPQEPARTNLALRSSALNTSPWDLNADASIVTEGYATAPDGTETACRVADNPANSNSPWLLQPITGVAGQKVTVSAWIKLLAVEDVYIGIWDDVTGWQQTDITSQCSTTDWTRVSTAFTFNAGATSTQVGITIGTAAARDFLIWGFQAEAGAYPTSYIPTTTAGVARAADALRCINAGVFGPLANEGSLLAVWDLPWISSTYGTSQFLYALNSAGGANERVTHLFGATGILSAVVTSGGAGQTSIDPGLGAGFSARLMATCTTWRKDRVAFSANGAAPVVDTSATMPAALDRLEIGGTNAASTRPGLPFYLVAAFSRALQDHEARALTSNPEALKWAS